MATDRERIKMLEIARLGGDTVITDAETATRQTHRRTVVYPIPVDAAASTQTTFPLWRKPNAVKIISCRFSTSAAVTANDTNYATIALTFDDDAGGSATTVGSQTTKITGGSGNITANQSISIPLTAANVYATANKAFHLAITKTGTGVQLPVSTVIIEYEDY